MSESVAKSAEIISKKWTVYGRAIGRNPEVFDLKLYTSMEVALLQLADDQQSELQRHIKTLQANPQSSWSKKLIQKMETLEGYFNHYKSLNFYKYTLDNSQAPVKIEREDIKEMIRNLKL